MPLYEGYFFFNFKVPRLLENDDIFITGLLREQLGIKPFYLNLRYSYDNTNYLKWLQGSGIPDNANIQPLPYLFVKIETNNPGWQEEWRKLWKKTIRIHSKETKIDQTVSPTVHSKELLRDTIHFY